MVNFEKNGKNYRMARFYAPSRGPRPESYRYVHSNRGLNNTMIYNYYCVQREDYESAEHYKTEKEKTQFYVSIKSGAETGWDFSSRWFITKNGSNHGENIYIHKYICIY